MQRYDRNLNGYGANPPQVAWPNGAKIAIQFVLNYEEGGENCLLHGDESSEAFLSEVVGAQAWQGQRHWNMESMYEYGARAGFWRLYRLFTEQKVPLTVFGVADALKRSPEQVQAMLDADWEIASHGLKWIEYKDFTPDQELDHMSRAARTHLASTGSAPRGWYIGRCSEKTVALLAQNHRPLYVADSYADDLPYYLEVQGEPQLVVPYTLDANDMRFATPQGFNSGDQFEAYLKDSFDALYAEGCEGTPKMLSIGLHCRLVGRPGRVQALRRFLEYVRSFDDVWFARRDQIAEHWLEHFPYEAPAREPWRMDKQEFIALFGGVFEHSAWVAERAFDDELSVAHNTAQGLHAALAAKFRIARPEERLSVLRAHPDLAGKLASAKLLTAESENEQASAGLDALTVEERDEFQALNSEYSAHFGHPFIIAVRGLSKVEILTAFKRRLSHTVDQELSEACRQVEKIALIRLKDLLP